MRRFFISLLFIFSLTCIFAETNEERLKSNQQKLEQFLNKGNFIKYKCSNIADCTYYPKQNIYNIWVTDSSIYISFIKPNSTDIVVKDESIRSTGSLYTYKLSITLDQYSNLEISKIKVLLHPEKENE